MIAQHEIPKLIIIITIVTMIILNVTFLLDPTFPRDCAIVI